MNDPIMRGQQAATPADDLAATLSEIMRDMREVAEAGPAAGEPAALILDRLAEEVTEAAARIRYLPDHRPAVMPGMDRQLLAALRTAHASGEDLGGFLARGLARLAAELGSSAEVLARRPGSWEAGHVAGLLAGTVGTDDEDLGRYRDTVTR